jgi:hypothetical protein
MAASVSPTCNSPQLLLCHERAVVAKRSLFFGLGLSEAIRDGDQLSYSVISARCFAAHEAVEKSHLGEFSGVHQNTPSQAGRSPVVAVAEIGQSVAAAVSALLTVIPARARVRDWARSADAPRPIASGEVG